MAALVRHNLRRLRIDGAAPWVLLGLVLVTSFGVAATPRFLNAASDEAIVTGISQAVPRNRNIVIEQGLRIPAGDGGTALAGVSEMGSTLRGAFAPSIEDVIDEQRYVADSPNFEMSQLPGAAGDPPSRFLRFRYQDGIAEQITVVAGRLPQPAGSATVSIPADSAPREVSVYEVAVTQATSDLLQLGVGARALLAPQRADPLTVGVPSSELDYRLLVEVSGIVELLDPDAEYWLSDERIHRPFLGRDPANPDAIVVFATGLMAPADYGRLLAETRSSLWNYGWRYFVNPDRIDASRVETLTDALTDLELNLGAGTFAGIDELRLSTGLDRLFDDYRSQRRLTVSVLSLAGAGLAALAVAVVVLLGAATAHRRRDAVTLARSRGASAGRLGLAQMLEGLVLFVPAALLGMTLAALAVEAREPANALPVVLGAVGAISILTVATALPVMRGDLGLLLGATRHDRPDLRRRLVLEGVVVIAAIVGLALLRRRGLVADDRGFDPFLAAVPVLCGLAFGIVLLRLYPVVLRLGSSVGGRDVAGFVGFSRLSRQPLVFRLPLPVTLLAVGIAVFAALVVHSVQDGRQTSTWQAVGADFRVEPVSTDAALPARLDLSDVASIEETAAAAVLDARTAEPAHVPGRITTLAVDTDDYQAVASGTRADPSFPKPMLAGVDASGLGTPANPIPVLVSSAWPGGFPPSEGEVIALDFDRVPVNLVVEEIRSVFPSLAPDRPFVVLPLPSLSAAVPDLDLAPTRLYIRAPVEAGSALEASLRAQSLGVEITSRSRMVRELADAPLVEAVDNGYRATVLLASLLAMLAALAGIALTAPERTRDLGYLRTMGLSSRQALAVTVIEQLPWALLATVGGVAFSYVLVWLVRPGFDLSAFSGGTLSTTVLVDWASVALVAGSVLLGLMAAVAIYSYRSRRMNLGDVLRLGDRR